MTSPSSLLDLILAARVVEAVWIAGPTVFPPVLAGALGVDEVLFEEALVAGAKEIDRLETAPAAVPDEDLAGCVILARGIRTAAEEWVPAIALALYDDAAAGDLEAREILERVAGASWDVIRAAVGD